MLRTFSIIRNNRLVQIIIRTPEDLNSPSRVWDLLGHCSVKYLHQLLCQDRRVVDRDLMTPFKRPQDNGRVLETNSPSGSFEVPCERKFLFRRRGKETNY